MDYTVRTQNTIQIIEISGVVDRFAAGQLYDLLVESIRFGNSRIVVDLSRVLVLKRAGIRGLIVAAKLLQTMKGEFRICATDPSTRAFLSGLGHDRLLKCDPTQEASVAALSAIATQPILVGTNKATANAVLPASASWQRQDGELLPAGIASSYVTSATWQ